MRKVILSEMVSLDGFFAGPNGELDWHLADEEFEQYSNEVLDSVDTLLFGRITYEGMANYWPTALTSPSGVMRDAAGVEFVVPSSASLVHREIASKMNELPKVVFSRTLKKAEWKNTKLLRDLLPKDIVALKQQQGRDIIIFGSGTIASTLSKLGLIDEYRLFVNPIVLGRGKPLFKDTDSRQKLKLVETKTFGSGLIGLYYRPL